MVGGAAYCVVHKLTQYILYNCMSVGYRLAVFPTYMVELLYDLFVQDIWRRECAPILSCLIWIVVAA